MNDDNEHSKWGVAAFPRERKQYGTFCVLQLLGHSNSHCKSIAKWLSVYLRNLLE